jgi:hypothetical protein
VFEFSIAVTFALTALELHRAARLEEADPGAARPGILETPAA